MGKYVAKRIGLAFMTAFIILSLTFILVKLLPFERPIGGDAQQIAYFDNQYALGYVYRFDHEVKEYGQCLYQTPKDHGRSNFYYQVPVMTQYFNWLKNIITKWDWGYSKTFQPNVAASVIIGSRIGYSIRLNILSVIFSVPIGILLGIWAALKKNTMTDHTISTLVMVFISIPSFVLISFMLRLFAYNLGWFPSSWPTDSASTAVKMQGYIIPVFCLAFSPICGYCRFTRAELCEVMESDYLLLARTKGLTRRQAILRHAMKNAMVPIFPSILAEFIGILGGSMILEQLYGIPGIGKLFVLSLNYKDYDILFVDMAIFTTLGLLAGILLDLSYGFIDPRIRMGAKK
ncbi:MAG: ABC transporter permease [Lachnospiraceae bacterium]|jgi:oligopeptide transport system permease protein|nr:ABC transporter permease [Lachnospiraceae bacterium]